MSQEMKKIPSRLKRVGGVNSNADHTKTSMVWGRGTIGDRKVKD